MITIKFYRDTRGGIHMTLRGHSGTALQGEDLVCAGATMLAYTAAQAVQFMHEQGKLIKAPKIHIREGNATVIATPTKDAEAEVLMIFWVAQCGTHVLSVNYPQNVRLEHLSLT